MDEDGSNGSKWMDIDQIRYDGPKWITLMKWMSEKHFLVIKCYSYKVE